MGKPSVALLYPLGGFMFAPLVSSRLGLTAEIDVLMLRHQRPGDIVKSEGDIDNRLKTLFDALSVPDANQIGADGPGAEEDPFFCVLENDVLTTKVSVSTDQWLEPTYPDDVVLVLHITVRHQGAGPTLWFWQ